MPPRAQLSAAQRDRERALAEAAGLDKVRAQARLASPVDGVVSARLVEPGSTIVAGQAVLQVIDPASLWVRARIDQGQAGGVRVGQPAEIALRSDPERVHRGAVERIDWMSDAVTEERIVNVGFAARTGSDLDRRAGRGDDPDRRARRRALAAGGRGETSESAGRRLAAGQRPRRVPAGGTGHHLTGRPQPDPRRSLSPATR